MPGTAIRPRTLALDAPPDEVAARLRVLPGMVWLDTAGHLPESEQDGGVSLLTALPRRMIRGHLSDIAPLEEALAELQAGRPDPGVDWGLPLAGLFGRVDFDGSYCFGLYDEVLIYRHATGEWLASGGQLPEAALRLPASRGVCPALDFRPSLTEHDFCRMVARAQEYIAAGDIYQVNLAHPFTAEWPAGADPFAFALRLRERSPAPYAAWLDMDGAQVISSSPESFLRCSGSLVRTRPVKGTRPRHRDPVADERSRLDLLTSEKERAELIMITDLLRNDIGQVCEYGSVAVTGLLHLERYEQVFHLVSTVQGTLRPGISHARVLQACAPGGSITGAPKRRACEIIAELEPHRRGLYTGAIGYLGSNGESQFSIAIRTVEVRNGQATFHAGAGIVADSIPAREWEETLHKAAGILSAARSW